MGLPSIAAKAGIGLYFLLVLVAALVNYTSFFALSFLCETFGLKNFNEIFAMTFGSLSFLPMSLLLLSNFGGMIGNLMILNRYLFGLLNKFGVLETEPTLHQNLQMICFLCVLFFPLLLKRRLKELFPITFITILIILFMVLFVILQFFDSSSSQ